MASIQPSFISRRIWRSIVPSGLSGSLCLFAGIVTVFIGVVVQAGRQNALMISVNFGSGPHLGVITALDRMLSRGSWRDLLVLVFWMVLLLLVCGGVEFLFGSYAKAQAVIRNVSPDMPKSHLATSEEYWLFERARWRMVVGLSVILGAVLLVQLVHWVSVAEKAGISGLSLVHDAWRMGCAALIWALVYHALVIFIRLYSFRPRLFRG